MSTESISSASARKNSGQGSFQKWRDALHGHRQAAGLGEPEWDDEYGIVRSSNGVVRLSRTLYEEGRMTLEDFAPVFVPLQNGFSYEEQFRAKRCFMTSYRLSTPEYRRALEDSALRLSDASPEVPGSFWDFETEYNKSYAKTLGTVQRVTLASEVPFHMPSF